MCSRPLWTKEEYSRFEDEERQKFPPTNRAQTRSQVLNVNLISHHLLALWEYSIHAMVFKCLNVQNEALKHRRMKMSTLHILKAGTTKYCVVIVDINSQLIREKKKKEKKTVLIKVEKSSWSLVSTTNRG